MAAITKLGKEDLIGMLQNYGIGNYQSHKHIPRALMNTVYELKTTKGRFILKIFEKANAKFINYQLRVIDFLAQNRIPVPETCKLNNGRKILNHNGKNMIVQKFIEGEHKEKIGIKLLKDISKNFGLMDKALLRLKIKDESSWKKDYQFKASKKNFRIKGFNYRYEEMRLMSYLRKLDRGKLQRIITHGDFHGVNLLVEGNKLKGIIDFDDSHEEYIAYEIAVFIIDPFIGEKKFNKKLAKIFFKEYQKHINLNQEERKAIYYFTKHRLLGIILWILGNMKSHKDKKRHLTKMLKEIVSKYKSFNKIEIGEFMELF